MPTKILLADDFPVVLEGLRRILDLPEFEIVGSVRDGRALVAEANKLRPDIAIVEVAMPKLNGIEAVRQIRKNNPNIKILFLSMHAEAVYAAQALRNGASGYMVKHEEGNTLLTAIREIRAGRTYVSESLREAVGRLRDWKDDGEMLTPRQREVLQLLAEGKQAKEIAVILNVSSKTVEFHKYRVMKMLGLATAAELGAYAAKRGISR